MTSFPLRCGSQLMRRFHETINLRRIELKLTYEDVLAKLSELAWPPHVDPPSLPTVGHWFNGTRRPRDMEHLKALCDVLQMSIDEAVRGEPAKTVTAEERVMLDIMRDLGTDEAQSLLGIAAALRKAGGKG